MVTTATVQWLNEHWFDILGPSLLVVVAIVVGLWLRSLSVEMLSPSRTTTMWRPGEIVLRRLRKSLVTWCFALGVSVAARLSVLAEPVVAIVNSAVVSIVVISIAWFLAGSGIELVVTYEPAVRRFLGRIRAPQPPTALLVNGIRVVAAVVSVVLLLRIWQGPDVIGPLSLVAAVVVAGLAIHDASEAKASRTIPQESAPAEPSSPAEPPKASEPPRPRKGSTFSRLVLSLIVVALFADTVRRLAFVPSEPGLDQNAALLWVVLESVGVVWALGLLLRRIRTGGKLVFPVVVAIAFLVVLIPTLLGVEPVSGYTRSLYREIRTDIAHADWLLGLPEPTLSPANVVEQIRPAVVKVRGNDEQGTGMTIDADGRVLTCWHVVEGCDVPRVLVQNRYSYDCTVEAWDAATDLALLVPVGKISTPDVVTLGSVFDVRPGDELWVIGYALALQGDASVTKGIVSAIRWIDDVAFIQTDAPMNPGNSGGPIVNNRGRVVAVASWKIADIQIEGMQFGVAIDHALPLLVFPSGTP